MSPPPHYEVVPSYLRPLPKVVDVANEINFLVDEQCQNDLASALFLA